MGKSICFLGEGGANTAKRIAGALPPPPGFAACGPGEWGRSMNQRVGDPVIEGWMRDPRLGAALADLLGEPAHGTQSMYFWRADSVGAAGAGPRRWHQDQTPLPGCLSA